MAGIRRLIVNADDFGLSDGVNEGIREAHEHGIVTSASLMVRQKAAAGAAELSRLHRDMSVGLHVDFAEWVFRGEQWQLLYQWASPDDVHAAAVEIAVQLQMFRDLMGREPTHLDSHQHVHKSEPLKSLLQMMARALNVPLRHYSSIHYQGGFYGQTGDGQPCPEGIEVEHLIGLLQALPAGATELGCHAGNGNDLNSVYKKERAMEVQTLCDPRVRDAITECGITLCSFYEFAGTG